MRMEISFTMQKKVFFFFFLLNNYHGRQHFSLLFLLYINTLICIKWKRITTFLPLRLKPHTHSPQMHEQELRICTFKHIFLLIFSPEAYSKNNYTWDKGYIHTVSPPILSFSARSALCNNTTLFLQWLPACFPCEKITLTTRNPIRTVRLKRISRNEIWIVA